MPHNRWMPTDRRVSAPRVVAAVSAMTAVMLLVAALGEWAILPSATLRELDEGSASRATAVLADHDRLGTAAHVWAALSGPWVVHPLVAIWTGVLVARRRLTLRAAVVTVAVGLLGWALGAVCKEIVDRPRPSVALAEVGSWSYRAGTRPTSPWARSCSSPSHGWPSAPGSAGAPRCSRSRPSP